MEFKEEAGALWRSYVPARGQADTVQGELMRAIEKLRDEAQRNGNVNWGKGHVILANYVGDQLVGSGSLDAAGVAEIKGNISRLLDFEHPETAEFPLRRADRPGRPVVSYPPTTGRPRKEPRPPPLGDGMTQNGLRNNWSDPSKRFWGLFMVFWLVLGAISLIFGAWWTVATSAAGIWITAMQRRKAPNKPR